jgi:AMP-polyphosphate phosphotransferase
VERTLQSARAAWPLDVATQAGLPRELDFANIAHPEPVSRQAYNEQLKQLQLDIVRMQQKVGDYGLRVLLVFEGMDAAGKGGAIKRLTQFLDPRGLRVHSLGPAGPADAQYHFLRRFWMRLPKRGRISIFDDYSWYSRLLADPVEGYSLPGEAERAPRQIRDFELTLAEEGYLLLKFWIHVSRDEQMKRFRKRLANPYKSWKMTPEDWRNREKFEHYLDHAQRMILATDAPHAPWIVLPGNDKLHARLAVLRHVVDALEVWPVDPTPYTTRFTHLRWLDEHGDFTDDD